MKKTLALLTCIIALATAVSAQQTYGDKITEAGAKPATELPGMMKDKKELKAKVTGKVTEACQKKGCWMKMDIGNGQTMRVSFKDYAFFVPKNCGGQTATIEGVASWQVTTVEELKHFAKDAGKPQAEIDAIKEPKRELVFEASGVIIK